MVPNHQPDNELYHCSDSSYMDLNGSQWTVDILDFHQFEKSRNITLNILQKFCMFLLFVW